MSQHDASYRQLFSSPHMVRCLFDGILQACADYGPGLPGVNDLDWDSLATLLFRLEHSQGVEDVRQLMQTIGKLTQDPCYDEVRRAFLDWATHVLLPRALDGQPTPAVHSLQEFDDMLAENTRSWTHQWKMEGRQEGIEEGRQKGEATLLQRLLVRKFGPLPEAIQQRITSAATAQLETWSLNILDAKTLDDVFTG